MGFDCSNFLIIAYPLILNIPSRNCPGKHGWLVVLRLTAL